MDDPNSSRSVSHHQRSRSLTSQRRYDEHDDDASLNDIARTAEDETSNDQATAASTAPHSNANTHTGADVHPAQHQAASAVVADTVATTMTRGAIRSSSSQQDTSSSPSHHPSPLPPFSPFEVVDSTQEDEVGMDAHPSVQIISIDIDNERPPRAIIDVASIHPPMMHDDTQRTSHQRTEPSQSSRSLTASGSVQPIDAQNPNQPPPNTNPLPPHTHDTALDIDIDIDIDTANTTTTIDPMCPPAPQSQKMSTHDDNENTCPTSPMKPLPVGVWRDVPMEILHLVASYLDAPSLVSFGRVEHRTRTVSHRPNHWRQLLRAQPWMFDQRGQVRSIDEWKELFPIPGVSHQHEPYEYYKKRREKQLEFHCEALKRWDEDVDTAYQNRRACCVHIFDEVIWAPILWLFLTLTIILLVYQLATGGTQSVSLYSLWPILAILCFLFLISLPSCCNRYRNCFPCSCISPCCFDGDHDCCHVVRLSGRCCPKNGFLPERYLQDSCGLPRAMMDIIGRNQSRRAHLSFTCMILLLALFIILLLMRISGLGGIGEWDWYQVFIPLYGAALIACCAPCLNWTHGGSWGGLEYCLAGWTCVGVPIVGFFILLNVRLELVEAGHGFLLTYVMCPLFMMDVFILIFAIYFTVKERNLAAIIMWLISACPLLLFKVLLILRVDTPLLNSTSYGLIFFPLYVTQIVMGVLTILWAKQRWAESAHEWDDIPQKPNMRTIPI